MESNTHSSTHINWFIQKNCAIQKKKKSDYISETEYCCIKLYKKPALLLCIGVHRLGLTLLLH